jgi:uncharacterized membrane protein YqhA
VRIGTLEIFIGQLIAWLALWLLNDYLATLLTLVLTAIVLVVLIIALLSEWIEPSRVPRRYFTVMAVTALAPVVAAVLFVVVLGGQISFLKR